MMTSGVTIGLKSAVAFMFPPFQIAGKAVDLIVFGAHQIVARIVDIPLETSSEVPSTCNVI